MANKAVTLQKKFPQFELDVVESVLAHNANDMKRATDELISLNCEGFKISSFEFLQIAIKYYIIMHNFSLYNHRFSEEEVMVAKPKPKPKPAPVAVVQPPQPQPPIITMRKYHALFCVCPLSAIPMTYGYVQPHIIASLRHIVTTHLSLTLSTAVVLLHVSGCALFECFRVPCHVQCIFISFILRVSCIVHI